MIISDCQLRTSRNSRVPLFFHAFARQIGSNVAVTDNCSIELLRQLNGIPDMIKMSVRYQNQIGPVNVARAARAFGLSSQGR